MQYQQLLTSLTILYWCYYPDFEKQNYLGPDGQETYWKPYRHENANAEFRGIHNEIDKQILGKREEEAGLS